MALNFSNFKLHSCDHDSRKSVLTRIHFPKEINMHNSPGVSKRIKYGNNYVNQKTVSYLEAGILGLILDPKRVISGHEPLVQLCSICLSPAHSRSACNNNVRCRRCFRFGHVSEFCNFLPRSSRLPFAPRDPSHSRNHRDDRSLEGGPPRQSALRIFASFTDYIKVLSGLSTIPSPITVPWLSLGDSRLWSSSTTAILPLLRCRW
jgi:hypothetical protein